MATLLAPRYAKNIVSVRPDLCASFRPKICVANRLPSKRSLS